MTEQPEMIERPVFPAKRSPVGYVAQRILAGEPKPWVLTQIVEGPRLHFELLTDDDVADWAPLYDELGDGGEIEQDEAFR